MANVHPKEQDIYDQISREGIQIDFHTWDLIYQSIGDDITAITHIASFYLRNNQAIEIEAARRIIEHTQKIRVIMDQILHPEKVEGREGFFGVTKLHPVIIDLFTHYLGNDVYGINMIACFYLDPMDRQAIPVEDAARILAKTATMKKFMDKLSVATNQEIQRIRKVDE